jgi:DNA invertase Pin-like site-specific DNA recombinase
MDTHKELIKQFVPYYRVSTEKQGRSGLGMRGQKDLIEHFFTNDELDDYEFVEVQSAKNIKDRPELKMAIEYCKNNNKTLVVAISDRLSRNVEDGIWLLNELNGKLYACDIPTNKGTKMDKYEWVQKINFAERERELISIRTKRGLSMSDKPRGRAGAKEFSEHKKKYISIKISQTKRQNFQNNEKYQLTLNYIEKRVKELGEQGYLKYTNTGSQNENMFSIIAKELNEFKFERARKNSIHTEYSTRKSYYEKIVRKTPVNFYDLSKYRLRLRNKEQNENKK